MGGYGGGGGGALIVVCAGRGWEWRGMMAWGVGEVWWCQSRMLVYTNVGQKLMTRIYPHNISV